jgi:hypothetical protein
MEYRYVFETADRRAWNEASALCAFDTETSSGRYRLRAARRSPGKARGARKLAAVRPGSAHRRQPAAEKPLHRRLQFRLHRPSARLNLPSGKIGPVVFQNEPINRGGHLNSGFPLPGWWERGDAGSRPRNESLWGIPLRRTRSHEAARAAVRRNGMLWGRAPDKSGAYGNLIWKRLWAPLL